MCHNTNVVLIRVYIILFIIGQRNSLLVNIFLMCFITDGVMLQRASSAQMLLHRKWEKSSTRIHMNRTLRGEILRGHRQQQQPLVRCYDACYRGNKRRHIITARLLPGVSRDAGREDRTWTTFALRSVGTDKSEQHDPLISESTSVPVEQDSPLLAESWTNHITPLHVSHSHGQQVRSSTGLSTRLMQRCLSCHCCCYCCLWLSLPPSLSRYTLTNNMLYTWFRATLSLQVKRWMPERVHDPVP